MHRSAFRQFKAVVRLYLGQLSVLRLAVFMIGFFLFCSGFDGLCTMNWWVDAPVEVAVFVLAEAAWPVFRFARLWRIVRMQQEVDMLITLAESVE